MTAPCKDCKRREIGCHGKCEEYAAFRARNERESARRREDTEGIDTVCRRVARIKGWYKWNRGK